MLQSTSLWVSYKHHMYTILSSLHIWEKWGSVNAVTSLRSHSWNWNADFSKPGSGLILFSSLTWSCVFHLCSLERPSQSVWVVPILKDLLSSLLGSVRSLQGEESMSSCFPVVPSASGWCLLWCSSLLVGVCLPCWAWGNQAWDTASAQWWVS